MSPARPRRCSGAACRACRQTAHVASVLNGATADSAWRGPARIPALSGLATGGGFPDPSTLPIDDLIEATRVALQRDGEWALQYAFGSGIPELVEQLRVKLARDQGIQAGPENILITNGASEALGLVFQLFVNP